ncbi:MAG: hypothetical protein NTV97_00235 [Alphaproteobacteria bacterium]|nr:hypothetical protein [Alphaproteobacteria bacterium]
MAPVIGALLQGFAASAAVRVARNAAAEAGQRLALAVAAGLAGAVALLCFSHSALTILERHMGPAESWAVIGAVYGIAGGLLYLASTRRRRG